MVRMSAAEAAVWRVLACHLDSADQHELLGYLAQVPDRWHSQGELAAHIQGDQLMLLAALAALQAVGLIEAGRRPEGYCYRLVRTPRVRALLAELPAYYAHLHH